MLDIKHYVERIYYTKGLDGCNKITEVEEVKKRNPAKVKMENHPDKELVGFRFFDENTILENGKTKWRNTYTKKIQLFWYSVFWR